MEKVNILLVDDQPGKLISYEAILADLNENLILARSGRQALQCLLKEEVALILLDVVMPEMDGFETATLIRQSHRFEQIPIIFVTALSTSDLDRLKGYQLGAVDYVFVPVVPEILRAKVTVFVDLYRKKQALQNLNHALEERVRERQRAEFALEEERASLARRVEERTAELSKLNVELARANRLKDEFLASMSHELRTPLNAILGIGEALQEQIYRALTEKQSKAIRSIEESGRHLLDLINDILDLSKIATDKFELEIASISVEAVCQASLRLVQAMAQKKQLKLSATFDSRVTLIEADDRRLKEILINLLTNAIKFTPPGGALGLEVAGDAENGVVRFIVWDTGIGISPEDLAVVFQPFIQLDSGLARQYAGAGLGLTLVRRMVEMHNGEIIVASEPGKGSRFTVSLPWKESLEWAEGSENPGSIELPPERDAVLQEDSSPPARRTSPTLVLIVDDNEINISTLSDYLTMQKYRVEVARNGNEAEQLITQNRPDLILMDIQMPGMDGLEIIRHVRARSEWETIPIIALTALAMAGDRERCLEAGADEYLSKPVSLRTLMQVMESLLHRETKAA